MPGHRGHGNLDVALILFLSTNWVGCGEELASMSNDASGRLRTVGRVLFLTALVLGFLLREVSPELEPYPAILLPAGSGTVTRTEGTVTFGRLELLGVGHDGSEHVLDPRTFFDPVPVGYWTYIARRGFGVSRSAPQRESLVWMRRRAASQGVPRPRAVRVRHVVFRIDVDDDSITDRNVVEAIEVPLAR